MKLTDLLPSLNIEGENHWLTLTASTDGNKWTAGYMNAKGGMLAGYYFEGSSVEEALEGLQFLLNLRLDLQFSK